VIPDTKAVVRTRPLEALIIGSYVRELSDRDIESLVEEAGLGQVSKTTVSRICRELRDRYRLLQQESGRRRPVGGVSGRHLSAHAAQRRQGRVLVACGYSTDGQRVLVTVRLGQREAYEDWLDLGRDLVRRGMPAPRLIVSDGAPGLVKAIEHLWPRADRGRCNVHKLRNALAKLPKRTDLRNDIKRTYWAALNDAIDPADAERRLRELVGDLERRYPSAAACLAE
jgi:putative transposase